jgi:phospholipid/cholesterol/gamma-HCH transport system substrate-binding protein
MRSMRFMVAALIAFIAVTGGIFAILFKGTGSSVRLDQPYTVSAIVPTGVQLSPTSNVRAAGVKIGSVTDVQPQPDGNAKITFEIDDEHAPLNRDVRLLVRTKTLLGENYLSVDPGSRRNGELRDGSTIPLKQSDDAVQLDDILSVFDAPTRASLRKNLRSAEISFDDRGTDLNRTLGALAPTVRDGGTVAAILADQRDQVHDLVSNTGQVLDALADRGTQLQTLARQGNKTADLIVSRDTQLAATVKTLPGLLRQAQSTGRRLGSFSTAAAPALDELTRGAVALEPTVRDLEPTARDAKKIFARIPRLTQPLLLALRRGARATAPMLKELDPLLKTLNPALRYLAPFNREVGAFFANVGGANNTYDAVGSYIRVFPLVAQENLALIDEPSRKLLDQLLDVTGVGEIKQLRTNPYPRPGTTGNPEPFEGKRPELPSEP